MYGKYSLTTILTSTIQSSSINTPKTRTDIIAQTVGLRTYAKEAKTQPSDQNSTQCYNKMNTICYSITCIVKIHTSSTGTFVLNSSTFCWENPQINVTYQCFVLWQIQCTIEKIYVCKYKKDPDNNMHLVMLSYESKLSFALVYQY